MNKGRQKGKLEKKAAAARAARTNNDAASKPCIVPSVHTDVCDCHGAMVNVNTREVMQPVRKGRK